ncbi:MAG: lysylphosphatidylglycerol synthase domain-containing protein [Jiangellaceae bacterium]
MTVPATPARARTSHLGNVVRSAVALLIVAAIGYAVVSEWDDVGRALGTLTWDGVALSFGAALAGMASAALAWRSLLAGEGYRLPVWAAGRIFLVGQLGKYLPGSIWSVVLQTQLARGEGIPRARAFTTSLAYVGLSLSSALVVGLVGLPVVASMDAPLAWTLVAILPVALICTHPRVLTVLVDLILRLLRKPLLPRPFTWRAVATAYGWLVVTWLLYGAHLWLLADSLGAPGWDGYVRSVGGFALAVTAGALFVVVPSGAGVREGLIVAALAGVMTTGEALGVAVASRAVFTTADVTAAGLAALAAAQLSQRGAAEVKPRDRLRATSPSTR